MTEISWGFFSRRQKVKIPLDLTSFFILWYKKWPFFQRSKIRRKKWRPSSISPHPRPRYLMVPYGTLWYHMVPYGTLWYLIVPYGTLWYLMVPYGTIWYHMVPYGTIWYLMVPYGTIWNHMVPYGFPVFHFFNFSYFSSKKSFPFVQKSQCCNFLLFFPDFPKFPSIFL